MKRFFLLPALAALAFTVTGCNIDNGLNINDGASFFKNGGGGGAEPAVPDTLPFIPGPDPVPPPVNCNGQPPAKTLAGTSWKVAGIGNMAEYKMPRELEPRDCERCYTLTFGSDTEFSSFASANTFDGVYRVNLAAGIIDATDAGIVAIRTGLISFTIRRVTKVGELRESDEKLWGNILASVESFSLQDNELNLRYTENGQQMYVILKPRQYDSYYKPIDACIGEPPVIEPPVLPPPAVEPPELPQSPALLRTKWGLTGIVDVGTGSLTRLEPDNFLYTLYFDSETALSAWSPANTGRGGYVADYETGGIRVSGLWRTEVYDQEDGELWWRILGTVESFSLGDNELKLFYDGGKSYLLFSR